MNLADMLSYADIHELSRIAMNYECQCDGHSKNELIQSILSTVNRREVFEHHIVNLNLEDLRFLNSILFDQRNSFSLEELFARVKQTKFAKEEQDTLNPREMISKFKQRGWLFNGYSHQTKYLFQIPEDLKRRFSDVIAKKFCAELTYVDEPTMYRDEQKLIVDDIFHFLSYLRNNEVTLTSDQYMYKRYLQQIFAALSVHEEPVSKAGWRFGYGRKFKEYPDRFSLIYDYCYYQELIAEQPQSLTLSDKGREKVMNGQREQLQEVYRFWLRLYKGPIHNLVSIVHWIQKLAMQWVTVQSLSKQMCALIKPFYYDTSESIFENRILQMMLHLGLIKIGEDERNGKVVQVTPMGSTIIKGMYVSDEDKIELPIDNAGFRN